MDGWLGHTSPLVQPGMIAGGGESSCLGAPRRFLGPQQIGDPQQIVGQYRRSHQHLETLAALGAASLHSAATK